VIRLNRLRRGEKLIADLALHPPSLQDATSLISHTDNGNAENIPTIEPRWANYLRDLPLSGLETAVKDHQRTMTALLENSSWSTVVAPHNITGPPVDVSQLLLEEEEEDDDDVWKEEKHKTSVNKSEDNSLLWVAYAAQKSKYTSTIQADDSENENDMKTVTESFSDQRTFDLLARWLSIGRRSSSQAERATQELLGEVPGEELLWALTLKSIQCHQKGMLLNVLTRTNVMA
jgi:hypothetical protein